MQVSQILNAKYRFAYSSNYTSRTIMTNKQNNNSDTFQKSALPSFKGYCVNKKLFNIIGESDDKLKTLAEVFYKEPDSQIKKACEIRHTNFIGHISSSKAERAYNEFMPHVNKVREHSQQLEQDIAKLTELSAKGDSNFSKQQDRIAKDFFELLKIEQSGRKIPNRNGIFIYGDAPNFDKKDFVEWFKKNVPANFEEITYDDTEPFESIKRIVANAENAEFVHKQTGKRTVLYIKEMDRLLTDEQSIESRRMIGRFKQFAEHCSERYHTTILLTTAYPLDEFEDASIASHRFETQIKLKDGIKPNQKLELENLQKEKDRLNKTSSTLDKYFWYSPDDFNDSNDSDRVVEGGAWGDFCDHLKYL